jgi:hypothetical protein
MTLICVAYLGDDCSPLGGGRSVHRKLTRFPVKRIAARQVSTILAFISRHDQ